MWPFAARVIKLVLTGSRSDLLYSESALMSWRCSGFGLILTVADIPEV